MPILFPDFLRDIGCRLFETAGCSAEDARIVTDHLVDSSLYGHDSHGLIRFYEYLGFFERGLWTPRGVPKIVSEYPCTAIVDGGSSMGQVSGAFAMKIAMQKAREHGTATVTLRNCSHLGRCGAYPLMAARNNLIAVAFVNAGRMGRQIAPHGGIDGKLSTNPIAFCAPRKDHDPIMVDMATSVTAEGKIRVARNRGESLPPGWITDNAGQPSVDPGDYLESAGAMLPLGGVASHKGYCLSWIVEVLGGALSGEGVASGEVHMVSNGAVFTVYDIEHFTDLDSYYAEIETLIRHLRTSRVNPDVGEILVPGEPEFRKYKERSRNGIDVDETTWSHICTSARGLGLNPDSWQQ
ncbi:MAG: Ldh family oxidoreductase [Fuerstiella sp.]|nr:Ldh family oxidoreductase [Fuerstiella sp.]